MSQRDELLRAARDYIIRRGWPVFVLSSSKVPVPNCERCRKEHTTPQQMRSCGCLTCHGFYAATLDMSRVEKMVRLHPSGLLAIRTGGVSGTVVIDVDAHGLPAMRQMIADGVLPRTLGTLPLTPAELRLLPYLQTHLTADKIAERLFLSSHTVKTQGPVAIFA